MLTNSFLGDFRQKKPWALIGKGLVAIKPLFVCSERYTHWHFVLYRAPPECKSFRSQHPELYCRVPNESVPCRILNMNLPISTHYKKKKSYTLKLIFCFAWAGLKIINLCHVHWWLWSGMWIICIMFNLTPFLIPCFTIDSPCLLSSYYNMNNNYSDHLIIEMIVALHGVDIWSCFEVSEI